MQSNQTEKNKKQALSKRFKPLAAVVVVVLIFVFAVSRTMNAGVFSFLSTGIQDVQASDQTGTSSADGEYSGNMLLPVPPSANPAGSTTASLPGGPIDDEALSPDLATSQISGIDGPNTSVQQYVVQSDDTLSGIADMFDISIGTIKQANSLTNDSIKPGQILTILPVSGIWYTVAAGDTFSGVAHKFNVDVADILAYNQSLSASTALSKGQQLVIPHGKASVTQARSFLAKQKVPSFEPLLDPVWNWPSAPAGYYVCPVPGARLSQGLHGHNAVDLAIAFGTPIHAAADGTVIIAKSNGLWNGGYGDFVMISHGNGSETLYAHMSRTAISAGDHVSQGQTIGYVGMTGLTTGPHVHFEIRNAQNPFVDPALCR